MKTLKANFRYKGVGLMVTFLTVFFLLSSFTVNDKIFDEDKIGGGVKVTVKWFKKFKLADGVDTCYSCTKNRFFCGCWLKIEADIDINLDLGIANDYDKDDEGVVIFNQNRRGELTMDILVSTVSEKVKEVYGLDSAITIGEPLPFSDKLIKALYKNGYKGELKALPKGKYKVSKGKVGKNETYRVVFK